MSETDELVRQGLQSVPPFYELVPEEFRTCNETLTTLQVNITYACNIACKHCHLECSPARTETMSKETLQACLDVFASRGFSSLDITGGAPELNPHFEWFIREAAARNIATIVRSNLCILEQPEFQHLPQLYADLGINVFASLPHYRKRNMEKQRGEGTFDAVIRVMQKLNELGYGKGEEGANANGQKLKLDLVFNPAGAIMPPDQTSMELEYKRRLEADFGVVFDNLYTFTNNPSGRFAAALAKGGKLEAYMKKLAGTFNPCTVEAMMCRDQLSVRWDGALYDCDFNQAIDLKCKDGRTIFDLLDESQPLKHPIVFCNHCYACCAGAGSS
ncbi:MAG: arsenosugar biosynthesis radical SAM protein ArsS [Coriobacteriia bacterium]|nr:arsenosugar biosynthesis radical SAM protein ArsS [Coriobacteriia bacterium]